MQVKKYGHGGSVTRTVLDKTRDFNAYFCYFVTEIPSGMNTNMLQKIIRQIRFPIATVILVALLLSCNNRERESYNYYNTLVDINNDLLVQVYESLYKTKLYIALSNDSARTPYAFESLQKSYASICDICTRNLQILEQTGPFYKDSILLKTYTSSIGILNALYEKEFSTILGLLRDGDQNSSINEALYNASLKLAENHIFVLDSVAEFADRYHLDIDSLQIDYHKKKAVKFRKDISRISNSICITGDCVNGFGQQEDQLGNVYTGYFRNGLFHGKGKLVLMNGDTYEGDFFNGSFEGEGLYTWQNGDTFRGEWRDDQINGIGTMFRIDGDTLFGYWENGVVKKF
jgi:hypothetical protein